MKLSASKAAKEVGVSIPTITRAIKSGRLSAEPVEGGGFLIDPAELFRVFPARPSVSDETPRGLGTETPFVTAILDLEVKMLREQLAMMQHDRDHWQAQAERVTNLLASSSQAASAEPHRSWWKRLVG